jgi:hypothetical protein
MSRSLSSSNKWPFGVNWTRFQSMFEVARNQKHKLVSAIRRRYPKAKIHTFPTNHDPRLDFVYVDGVDRDVMMHEMREYRPRGQTFYFKRKR